MKYYKSVARRYYIAMEEKLRKQIDLVLNCSKGYFKGCFCHPLKAQMLNNLLDKKELTAENKKWLIGSSEVTAFEQSMLFILNDIVFVLNHSKEDK